MISRVSVSLVVVGSLLAVGVLTGCSGGGLPGGFGGGSSPSPTRTNAAGAADDSGGTGNVSIGCHSNGTSIPAGSYSGDIDTDLKTTMSLAGVAGAGSSDEPMDGVIHLTSNGSTVTGEIALSGLGTSEVGTEVKVHSKTEGDLTGPISGPADAPIVTAKLGGAWKTIDAPIGSSGSSTGTMKLGLHIKSVSCAAITGDAIAMFAEAFKPVAAYLTISGTGIWIARRTK